MLRLRRLGLVAAALAAAWLGGGRAAAEPAWQPHEDDALLFEARLGQYSLGDGIRGYQTPDGVCVNLPDAILALDIPVEIDAKKGIATGWAFEERKQLKLDRRSGKIRVADRLLELGPTAIRDTPEGWCVAAVALSTWLGVELKPDLSNATLVISSKTKLPVQLAAERRARAARVRPASQLDLRKLPQARLPYEFWRMPTVDSVVTLGGLSDKQQGRRFERQVELYASGEVARLSFDSRFSSDRRGRPADLRMRAYRSSADGGLLGPIGATHFEVGDVSSLSSQLVASSTPGRGFMVTNRPLDRPDTFDRKTFRGELPSGWDAELYRNGQLLAVAQNRADGRYEFADVPLIFGQNRIEIVLYGPQGQVRRTRETLAVGAESIPPRETWYWASVSQDDRDLVAWRRDRLQQQRGWRGSLGLERGIDARTSASLQMHSMVIEDERLTFVEGGLRRSVGSALIEVGAAHEKGGGRAGRVQLLAQRGDTYLAAESMIARKFRSDRVQRDVTGLHAIALEHTFDLGKMILPVHVEGRYLQRENGSNSFEGQARVSTNLGNFSVTAAVDARRQRSGAGPDPPDLLEASLLANGHIGRTRVRGDVRWRLAPENRFVGAAVVADHRVSEFTSLRGELGYDRELRRFRAGGGYVRDFDAFSLSLTGEAATDGSVAAGLNLAFSFGLDPRGGFRLASQKLAAGGTVLARVYRDENGDGRREPGEPLEKEVQIMVQRSPIERVTDNKGEVIIDGLEPHLPVHLAVDASSLPDPLVQPSGLGVAVTPRPGLATIIDLPLVSAGEILGTLTGANGKSLEGVDLELVDGRGLVVATVRSDYDGFFLFESVPYGSYELRVAKLSAAAVGVPTNLGRRVTLGSKNPSARLGNVAAGAPLPFRLTYQDVLMTGPAGAAVYAR